MRVAASWLCLGAMVVAVLTGAASAEAQVEEDDQTLQADGWEFTPER